MTMINLEQTAPQEKISPVAGPETEFAVKASFYDVEYTDQTDHDFLANLITDKVQSILEIPCGVGRNSFMLASSGRRIVSVDREPEMIKSLRTKIDAQPECRNIHPQVGDMTSFDLGETFDLIIVPREAFQMLDKAEASLALICFQRHLSPGGRLMIDMFSFDRCRSELSIDNYADWLVPDYYDPLVEDGTLIKDWERPYGGKGGTVTRKRVQQHHPDQVVHIDFYYCQSKNGEVTASSTMPLALYSYQSAEFQQKCEEAGLGVLEVFGNYQCHPYQRGDLRSIYLLGRKQDMDLPPSGRLQESYHNFDNQIDASILKNFEGIKLCEDKLAYFQHYLNSYFNGPFLPGMGAEEILAAVSNYGRGGNVLDLGAGTSTAFWLLPLQEVRQITCADVVCESLKVLSDFLDSGRLPQCYRDIMAMYALTDRHQTELWGKIGPYMQFDCFSPWPDFLKDQRYDTITAFGVYAIAKDRTAFETAIGQLPGHLAENGRVIGAEWIRAPGIAVEDGGRTDYLDKDCVQDALSKAGLTIQEISEIEIENDSLFNSIILWIAEKK